MNVPLFPQWRGAWQAIADRAWAPQAKSSVGPRDLLATSPKSVFESPVRRRAVELAHHQIRSKATADRPTEGAPVLYQTRLCPPPTQIEIEKSTLRFLVPGQPLIANDQRTLLQRSAKLRRCKLNASVTAAQSG
jgi:hypothetical protein